MRWGREGVKEGEKGWEEGKGGEWKVRRVHGKSKVVEGGKREWGR